MMALPVQAAQVPTAVLTGAINILTEIRFSDQLRIMGESWHNMI